MSGATMVGVVRSSYVFSSTGTLTGTAISSVMLTPSHPRMVDAMMMKRIRYANISTGCGTLLPTRSTPSSSLSMNER